MTETTTLGLLRHGQTDWNVDFRLQGVTDIPLNETGLAQARAAAAVLRSGDWDVLLTSPLVRASKTAQIVAESFGGRAAELVVEPMLLERSFGSAEGMLHSEWLANFKNSEIAGAETRQQLATRTQLLFEHIAEAYAGRRVLAVSHGALIREALGLVSGYTLPPEGERIGNACLNRFEYNASTGWLVSEYAPKTLGA
ncbi:MAG: hypothetical protein RL672_239 [Actinomycetota bacterium]